MMIYDGKMNNKVVLIFDFDCYKTIKWPSQIYIYKKRYIHCKGTFGTFGHFYIIMNWLEANIEIEDIGFGNYK